MDFSRRNKIDANKANRDYSDPSGKPRRTPEAFIQMCKDLKHPCCRIILYNQEMGTIVEALKDMVTKRRHLLYAGKVRGSVEAEELDRLIIRDNLQTGKNNKQIELIIGGDEYKKPVLKSR